MVDGRPGEAAVRHQRRRSVALLIAAAISAMTLLTGCSTGSTGTTGSTSPSAPTSPSVGPSSSSPSLTGQSAGQIMAATIAAVRAAGSVRVVAHDVAGSRAVSFVDDVSATTAREVITTDGGGRATFLLIAGVGYLRGNAAALENYYGFPAQVANQISGRWIAYHPNDQGYQQLTTQVTLAGFIDTISLGAPLARRGSHLVGHQPAIAVQGTLSAASGAPAGTKATLYVASTGRPLPLLIEGNLPGAMLRATFSNWGEPPLHLTPPANPLPASAPSP